MTWLHYNTCNTEPTWSFSFSSHSLSIFLSLALSCFFSAGDCLTDPVSYLNFCREQFCIWDQTLCVLFSSSRSKWQKKFKKSNWALLDAWYRARNETSVRLSSWVIISYGQAQEYGRSVNLPDMLIDCALGIWRGYQRLFFFFFVSIKKSVLFHFRSCCWKR